MSEEIAAMGEGDSMENFGELLRHEVNNPLTGILGNVELLLARRDGLPPAAVERLETIAELAVRLRETIRRLSHTWERHDQIPSS
jgi:signal transduction histidine kinase